MQLGQLKALLEAFVDFSGTVCGDREFGDLESFTAALSFESSTTTARFVSHLKKSLGKTGKLACPTALISQLKGIKLVLEQAASKSSGDIASLLSILDAKTSVQTEEFIANLKLARDFVASTKPAREKATPKSDAVVEGYLSRLQSTVLRTSEFEGVLRSLRADTQLSDARVKKIAKSLWGRPAKTREQAIEHIIAYRNSEALSYASSRALELTPV